MRRYADIEVCCEGPMEEREEQFTQRPGYGDRARSHEQLKEDQIRKPSRSEGLAFREKINQYD